jgi:hypothetical protein
MKLVRQIDGLWTILRSDHVTSMSGEEDRKHLTRVIVIFDDQYHGSLIHGSQRVGN